jgi:hypothetical protein
LVGKRIAKVAIEILDIDHVRLVEAHDRDRPSAASLTESKMRAVLPSLEKIVQVTIT